MSLTVTNTTLSSTFAAAKSELETNFADIISKFGSIDNSDVSSNAGITPTKLSAPYQEMMVQLGVRAESLAAGLPGAGTLLDAVPIPGSNGDAAWSATDVSWVCSDTGAGTGAFKVELGEFNVAGAWAQTTAIVSGITLANTAAANDGNEGKALENGNVSLAYAATSKSIGLLVSTADATALSAAGSFLRVSVRLRRVLQSA